jgi:hypothetical protein
LVEYICYYEYHPTYSTGTKFAGCGAADLYETLLAKGNTDKTLMNTNKTNSPLDTPSKTTIDDICAKTDALKLDVRGWHVTSILAALNRNTRRSNVTAARLLKTNRVVAQAMTAS